MQSDTKLITEVLEIRAVGLVWNIIHNDMCSLNRYLRFIDTRTLSHKSGKHERVLSSRKGYEDTVIIFQKVEINTSLIERFSYPLNPFPTLRASFDFPCGRRPLRRSP